MNTLLDLRTIIVMTSITSMAMSIVLYAAHQSFPAAIRGLGDWAKGALLVGIAAAMFGTRDIMPDWFSVVGTNAAMCGGIGFWMIGTRRFYNLAPAWRVFFPIFALELAGIIWWLWISPNIAARVIVFSSAVFIFYFLQFLMIARHSERHFSSYFFGFLMFAQSVAVLARVITSIQFDGSVADILAGRVFHFASLATSNFTLTLLPIGFLTVATRRLQTLLEHRSNLDPLTNILNRRGFAMHYAGEKARMKRSAQPMTLLSIDLDYFKSINDRFGHGMGDRVLRHTAEKIGQTLRQTDYLARFGGEEFVALLPGVTAESAALVASRIQASLDEARPDDLPTYTVSVGIASQFSADEDLDSVMARADAALYRAKAGGRNRVEVDEQSNMQVAA